MKSTPEKARLGWFIRVFSVFVLVILSIFTVTAQCVFNPATLPTLTFPSLPGNCLATAQKIPVPKTTPAAGCQIVYSIFTPAFANVPPGDTSITIAILPVGTTTITWAFADGAGGFYGSTTQNIVITDTHAPNFTFCPPSLAVTLKPTRCDTVLVYNAPAAFDACGLNPAAPVLISGLASGSKFPIGNTVTVFRATDVNGNSSTCAFTYTVNDFPTPMLNCRDTVRLVFDQTCETELKATQIFLGTNYGCPTKFTVKIRKTPTGAFVNPNLNADDAGKYYTYQLLNPATNQTCTGKMIVRDTIKPTVNCSNLKDTTFTLGALQCAVLPNFTLPTANDNCNLPVFSGSPIALLANGQFAKPFPPGVTNETIKVTDASGNFATCKFKVTVNPYLTQQTLVCVGQINLSLDATCKKDILADEVLSGNQYACYDYYEVSLFRNNQWTNNHADSSDVGHNYPYRVHYPPTGQTCWGNVLIEDKVPPIALCKDTTVQCHQLVDSLLLGLTGLPTVIEGCGIYDLTFSDSVAAQGCQGSKIFRKWVVTDGSGNTSVCNSVITREAGKLADLIFPKDTILPCTIGAYPTPAIAGMPTLKGNPLAQACGIGVTSSDSRLPICDGSFKISRLWTATNFCTSQSISKLQIITVMDLTGPVILNCPKDTLISSNTGQCCGNYRIPSVRLWDGCSRIKKLEAKIPNGAGFVFVNASLVHQNFTMAFANDTVARFDTIICLPAGNTILTLIATDHCGNSSSCTFKVRVTDLTTPVAFCPGFPTLSLSTDDPNDCYLGDVATVNASILGQGSADDCSPFRVTGQRMTPLKPCITGLNTVNGHPPCNDNTPDVLSEFALATQEATTVKFYCCETGDTVRIRVKIYQLNPDGTVATFPNGQQIVNSCISRVIVQDISPPTCTPPPDVTVACSAFNPSAPPAISPVTPDSCCTPTFTAAWQTPTMFCGGVNTRIFTVKDCHDNTATCTQKVTVLFAPTSYSIKFPDDVAQNGCSNFPPTPPVVSQNTGCTKFKSIFSDSLVAGTGVGFCQKIFRRWTIFDTCATSTPPTAANLVEVPNPTPATVGPTIAAGNPLYNTVLNAYRYTQEITLTDNVPPQILAGCTPASNDVLCDTTPNDPLLFVVGNVNLFEIPHQPSITASDDCSRGNLTVSYVFQMDFDKNGTIDQTINSASPPAGWGLTQVIVAGQKIATMQSPGASIPQGRHTLTWTITDLCGNKATCTDIIIVNDCTGPKPSCKAAFSKALQKSGNDISISVAANELNNGSSDNSTPANQLQFALRIKDTGTGYPPTTSLLFNCFNVSPQNLEMWVRDLGGNVDFCETTVEIVDPSNFCGFNAPPAVSGSISTMGSNGLRNVTVAFGDSLDLDLYGSAMTDSLGKYQIATLPGGVGILVSPDKNTNPLNGVTTLDLLGISKHILGAEPFDDPAEFIAADVNRSNSVTTFDIVEIRKLILGIYQNFPNAPSWRFVPKSHVFSNLNNPFQPPFPEKVTLDSAMISGGKVDFLAIKTGDVNGSAGVNFNSTADDRSEGQLPAMFLQTENREFSGGEIFKIEIGVLPGQRPEGFQLTLNFDPKTLELQQIEPGKGMAAANFGWLKSLPGTLTISWDGDSETPAFSLTFKALRSGELSENLQLADEPTPREAYFSNSQLALPMLVFGKNSGRDFLKTGSFLTVLPNPTEGSAAIRFLSEKAEIAHFKVADAAGRVLQRFDFQAVAGFNFLLWEDCSRLSAGVYFLEMQVGGQVLVERVLVR